MSSALDVLPAELWDIIFNLHPCNEMLLSLATVCRAFNERCIRIHFTQLGVSLDDLLNGECVHLVADSLVALSLYSPCTALPMHELICVELDAQQACRFIACLDNVVLRSPELKFLSVSFNSDLFKIPFRKRKIALPMLCSVVSGLTERVGPTPVFVCTRFSTFSCRAGDISDWSLPHYRFNAPTANSRSWLGARGTAADEDETEIRPAPFLTPTRLHDGTTERVPALRQLSSIEVQLTGSPSGSFVTFDASFITSLTINCPPTPARITCLEAMLAYAQLPNLTYLYLFTHRPSDPALLRRFLMCSPNLHQLQYVCLEKGHSSNTTILPLVEPPLAHPSLTHLQTRIAPWDQQPRSIVAGLASSPNIEAFKFSLESFILPVQANRLLHDLNCIAARTSTNPVTLNLVLTRSWHQFKLWDKERYRKRCSALNWVDDPLAMDIAGRMQHVCSVDMWFQSIVDARRLLTWLAALPDLTRVSFTLRIQTTAGRWYSRQTRKLSLSELRAAQDGFLKEAREALPHVASVFCSMY
ncbi:hypothetical protein C8F01DRAFT_1157334 [Mycena amicta]|nr:hypothetical protein C8F01DRAFT_1157334 [Mycena amicta]